MKKFLIFGDSIPYGRGDNKGGWVNWLKVDLDSKYENSKPLYQFFNLGIPGDNTEDLVGRIENEIEARSKFDDEIIIIIQIGINDTQTFTDGRNQIVSLEKFKSNIKTILKISQKYTNKAIVLGLTRVDESKVRPNPWKPETYYDNQVINKYDAELRNISKEFNSQYINLSHMIPSDMLVDGLHPNPQGHELIYNLIGEELKLEVDKSLPTSL